MREYLQKGHAERVSLQKSDEAVHVYYMPHQRVIHEQCMTPNQRVVFYCSAHMPGKLSVNDQLEKGPQLIADLARIFICYRLHVVTLTADIEKTFLQISVQPKDRNALRFLWYEKIPTDPPPFRRWKNGE